MSISADTAPFLVAVTGASGSVYARAFLEIARGAGRAVHLVVSDAGRLVVSHELGPYGMNRLEALAEAVYDPHDIAAPPASGSASFSSMVVIPCSMGTLGAVASGTSHNLIHRAADCFLKQRRPLVLVPRESPINRIHIENLLRAHDAGAVIFPAMPSFYDAPASVADLALSFAARIADFLGIAVPGIARWQGINR